MVGSYSIKSVFWLGNTNKAPIMSIVTILASSVHCSLISIQQIQFGRKTFGRNHRIFLVGLICITALPYQFNFFLIKSLSWKKGQCGSK